MTMPTATNYPLVLPTNSTFGPDDASLPSNDMPITPGSDVMILDPPPISNDPSSPPSEIPPLVSDSPSLTNALGIRHILAEIPCPQCPTRLTAPTSRGHLQDEECGESLRWAALRDSINRESNRTGADSIPITRLQWMVEEVFTVTIPAIIARLDESQDGENSRAHIRRWYELEDGQIERAEHTNAQIHSVADDVAALNIDDQI